MFGTSGVRGGLDELPPERYVDLGRAVGDVYPEVVVGRDARLTGEAVSNALHAGLTSAGCRVVDVGRAPTHLVAYAARERKVAGVVVTASHNPPEYNGVKLFEADGAEASEEREQEVVDALDGAAVEWRDWASRERAGVLDGYVDDALDYLGSWTTGDLDVEVAVDVGNGVAGRTTVPLLRALGADVVPVNAQEDGRFPSRPSEPRSEVVGDYVEFVKESGVDIGFAHDGDGDRLVVVDDGGVVSEDGVVAVLARETLESSSSDVVVTTPNTSRVVDRYVENAGGVVERVPLGGLAPAVREQAPAFAAEPWKPVFPDWGPW
ncbi:MAG: phosphomannomutase, partial [Halobacteriota archaeon]